MPPSQPRNQPGAGDGWIVVSQKDSQLIPRRTEGCGLGLGQTGLGSRATVAWYLFFSFFSLPALLLCWVYIV